MTKPSQPGANFERDIAAGFKGYADGGIARLAMMPVPMRPIGYGHNVAWRPMKKAPFDVYGFLLHDGRFIGAELKSSKRKPSLSIVAPDGKGGDGLQFHQLDALADVALAHGIARLVWHNGGDVGILLEDDILDVRQVYEQALTGGDAPAGAKSIKWERFTPADWTNLHGTAAIDWLRYDLIDGEPRQLPGDAPAGETSRLPWRSATSR